MQDSTKDADGSRSNVNHTGDNDFQSAQQETASEPRPAMFPPATPAAGFAGAGNTERREHRPSAINDAPVADNRQSADNESRPVPGPAPVSPPAAVTESEPFNKDYPQRKAIPERHSSEFGRSAAMVNEKPETYGSENSGERQEDLHKKPESESND